METENEEEKGEEKVFWSSDCFDCLQKDWKLEFMHLSWTNKYESNKIRIRKKRRINIETEELRNTCTSVTWSKCVFKYHSDLFYSTFAQPSEI